MNKEINKLILIAKNTVRQSLKILSEQSQTDQSIYFMKNLKREIKASVDQILHQQILISLNKTNIPIVSEEDNKSKIKKKLDEYWIIDPLDGTFNFIRDIGSCSISVAYIKHNRIIFGVVGQFPSKKIFWGGKSLGSFVNNKNIQVSSTNILKNAVLATGFPSRYKFNQSNLFFFFKLVKKFSKVRMLGAASVSLVKIAEGKIDVYIEKNIMFWDIAAGLAIVEGAGGTYVIKRSKNSLECDIISTNNKLKLKLW